MGAQGFIGSHVVRAALAAGADQVRAVCTGEPWRLADLADARLAVGRVPGDRWWRQEDQAPFAGVIGGAEVTVILAYRPPEARSGPGAVEHELGTNAVGALRVAETAAGLGQRVVFASSADVYGRFHPSPVDERQVPAPATAYAVAKLAAEHLVTSVAGRGSLLLRIATVFGPGENGPRAVPSFIRALLAGRPPVVHGAGDDVRDYVHVGDVAAAIVNGCVREEDGPAEVLNVGSGRERTTLGMLDAVAAAMGQSRPQPVHRPRSGSPSRLVLDSGAARKALGLEPEDDLAGLLEDEVRWLRAHCRTP